MFIARPDNRDPAPVGASWQRIEAWFGRHQPAMLASLRAGASDDQLRDFEERTGLTLPDDVRASYQIHDGDRDGPGVILGAGLNALADVARNWASFAELHAEIMQSDVAGPMESECTSFPAYAIRCLEANSRWVPLYDWDGRCYGVDLDPGPIGVWGQVINFGGGEYNKFVLALSWAQFLEDIADELEAGNLVLAPDWRGELMRITRAGQNDVGFFHYCEEWAVAKLPADFRASPHKPTPEYPGVVVNAEQAEPCVRVVEQFITAMHRYETKWLEILPLERFGCPSTWYIFNIYCTELSDKEKEFRHKVRKSRQKGALERGAIVKRFCTDRKRFEDAQFSLMAHPVYDPSHDRVAEVRQVTPDYTIVYMHPQDDVTTRYHVRGQDGGWRIDLKDETVDHITFRKVSV